MIRQHNKRAAESGEAEYDEESFNWVEKFSLLGLDPLLDLNEIRIPKKEGIPEDEIKEEVDEDGNPLPPKPKVINPDDYNLGIQDLQVFAQR